MIPRRVSLWLLVALLLVACSPATLVRQLHLPGWRDPVRVTSVRLRAEYVDATLGPPPRDLAALGYLVGSATPRAVSPIP